MAKVDFPGVQWIKGIPYFRQRTSVDGKRKEHRIPIPDPNDPTGIDIEKYRRLTEAPAPRKNPRGSMAELIYAYRASPEFAKLSPQTRRNRDHYLSLIDKEHGRKPYADLETPKVYEIRDVMADRPGAADNMIGTLSALMTFAVKRGYRATNPCKGVERLSQGEHEPWPQDVMDKALKAASPMLRLAIQAHYYTGQRIGDVCRMQWHQIKNGEIEVVQQKTGKRLWVPLHTDFAEALQAVPKESVYILYNRSKQPFKPATLRERLARLMSDMGVDYKFHGLKKNATIALIEAGCTTWETASVTGNSEQLVAYYARRHNQRELARRAILKWEGGATGAQNGATE